MTRHVILSFLTATIVVGGMWSCKSKPQLPLVNKDGNFPQEVAQILVSKCAVSGCHNQASYLNANGLLLDSWEHLFQGGTSGAEVVPYSPEYSTLLYFVNTDSSLGTVATPTMPISTTKMPQAPLTKAEYMTLRNWIAAGAPDKYGNIAFASNAANRQKIYLTQQGCDLVAVIDGATGLVMRYIKVGISPAIESPHCIRAASNGLFAYISFLNGIALQKIDMTEDKVVGQADVGTGSWNIVYVAPADTAIVSTNWVSDGYMAFVGAENMKLRNMFGGGSTLVYPHGITSSKNFDTFYVTAQYGNVVYKFTKNASLYKQVRLDNGPAITGATATSPDPHEILMLPDHKRYYVTCENTNQVKLVDAVTDSVLKTIDVGTFPQEMAISTTYPYLFVSCMEDANVAGARGSVYVINYNTQEVVAVLKKGMFQPHAVGVDDQNGKIYIVSTNASVEGPAPHHATSCGGRAGWYSVYNLSTLAPVNNNKYQVAVMPYSIAIRYR